MDRALREFRIRGIKTNIPFLDNVVNHPKFQAGDTTTSFLAENPALFNFAPRRDRATKLLTYLGEVIVNGNPEVKDKPRPPELWPPATSAARFLRARPTGTKQLLDRLGAEGFAKWTLAQERLMMTDTTFRDAHQSLMATRVRTYDMMAIANYVSHRLPNLYSVEMWGGATFDVALRFLLEDPWLRLRRLREAIPEHLLPDAAAGFERGRVHSLSGQRGGRIYLRGGAARHRYFPHFRFAELASQHADSDGGSAQERQSLRGGDLLHGRYPRPAA